MDNNFFYRLGIFSVKEVRFGTIKSDAIIDVKMKSKLYTIIINYKIYPFILGIFLTDGSRQVSKKP